MKERVNSLVHIILVSLILYFFFFYFEFESSILGRWIIFGLVLLLMVAKECTYSIGKSAFRMYMCIFLAMLFVNWGFSQIKEAAQISSTPDYSNAEFYILPSSGMNFENFRINYNADTRKGNISFEVKWRAGYDNSVYLNFYIPQNLIWENLTVTKEGKQIVIHPTDKYSDRENKRTIRGNSTLLNNAKVSSNFYGSLSPHGSFSITSGAWKTYGKGNITLDINLGNFRCESQCITSQTNVEPLIEGGHIKFKQPQDYFAGNSEAVMKQSAVLTTYNTKEGERKQRIDTFGMGLVLAAFTLGAEGFILLLLLLANNNCIVNSKIKKGSDPAINKSNVAQLKMEQNVSLAPTRKIEENISLYKEVIKKLEFIVTSSVLLVVAIYYFFQIAKPEYASKMYLYYLAVPTGYMLIYFLLHLPILTKQLKDKSLMKGLYWLCLISIPFLVLSIFSLIFLTPLKPDEFLYPPIYKLVNIILWLSLRMFVFVIPTIFLLSIMFRVDKLILFVYKKIIRGK